MGNLGQTDGIIEYYERFIFRCDFWKIGYPLRKSLQQLECTRLLFVFLYFELFFVIETHKFSSNFLIVSNYRLAFHIFKYFYIVLDSFVPWLFLLFQVLLSRLIMTETFGNTKEIFVWFFVPVNQLTCKITFASVFISSIIYSMSLR